MDKANRNFATDRPSEDWTSNLDRGTNTSQKTGDVPRVPVDQDTHALASQQKRNEAKQNSGAINTEAGLDAQFGDNRHSGLGGVDMSRDSTQLPSQNQNWTMNRDQRYQMSGQTAGANQRADLSTSNQHYTGADQQKTWDSTNLPGQNIKNDQSRNIEKSEKDLIGMDRNLTHDISHLAKEENTTDHLQNANRWDTTAQTGTSGDTATNPAREVGGPGHMQNTSWTAPETRDFQTDKTANALSKDQMAAIDKNASYRTTTNPTKEVGGTDHLRGWM